MCRSTTAKLGLGLALALAGCGEALEDGASGVPSGPDGGVDPGCSPPTLAAAGRCVRPPRGEDGCAYAAENPDVCEDADQDCFVECRALPTDFYAEVYDCDDRRPDVRPGRAELCNDLDDDCDGLVDEGFDVGAECVACGATGKSECAIDDPSRVACSVEARQSRAPDAVEVCDDLDDDCDGEIDEGCATPLSGSEAGQPVVCPGGVAYVVDGVVRWQPDDGAAVDVSDAGARSPTCGATHLAWLAVPDASGCDGGVDRAPGCAPASLMLHALGGETTDLTGAGALGAPLIAAGWIYWHALVGDAPTMRRRALDGGSVESIAGVTPLSDPAAPEGDTLVARRWSGAPEIVVVSDGAAQVIPQPSAPASAPAANDAWIVWAAGDPPEALWAAPRGDVQESFQITDDPGPHWHPRVAGDRVVWVSGGELRVFELMTGTEATLATGVARDAFAADANRAVWIADRDGAPALFQWWWP